MAELMFQNLGDAIQKGYQIGTANRVQRETEMRQNQLRDLASQAYAAPSGQRSGIIQQAVSVDPDAGFALGDKLEEREVNQSKRAANVADYMLRAFESKNPAQIQGAYQAVKPYFQGIAPDRPLPDQADESMLPMLYQMKAAAAGSADAVPTGFAEFDMKARAAGLTPGSPEYQEAANIALGRVGRAASGGFGFTEIVGPDGRKRQARRNPRTGSIEVYNEATGDFDPVGGAGSLNPQQFGTQMAPGEVPFSIDPSLPPEVQAAIRANPQQFANATEDQPINIPGMVRQAPQFSPLSVGRSPEEEARATEQAKIDAEIANYDRMTQLMAARESATTSAATQAKAAGERANQASSRVSNAERAIPLIEEAIRILPNATASGVGAARDAFGRQFGITTEGAQAAAQLDIIAPQLVGMVPRFEGPQSDADRRLYEAAAGDLNNRSKTVGERVAAAQQMLRLHRKANESSRQKSSTGWSIQRID